MGAGMIGNRNFIIYTLKCPITKEIRYIGQTCHTLKRRLQNHYSEKGSKHKDHWIASLKKSKLVPIIEQIGTANNKEEANTLEIAYIKFYRDIGFRLTNSSDGGGGTLGYSRKGYVASQQTRLKLSLANKGRSMSEEQKKKISDSLKGHQDTIQTRMKKRESRIGKHHTIEVKLKMSKSLMNNTRWLGKTHTIETKLKMSKVSPNKVGIIQLSLEGIYIRSWDSITEASANLSINPVSICQCCKGNYSKAGNFKWTYQ